MTNPNLSRARTFRLLPTIFVLTVICCASLSPSFAQAPPPIPPAQQQFNTGRSRSLGEHIASLNIRATQLIQVLQTQMLRLSRWVEYFAWLLALVLIPASAVREWHENSGRGRNLFWWFGRLAVCLLLFGSAVPIIDELYVAGREIAEGNEAISGQAGQSLLFEFYSTQRDSFNQSYDKLVDGNFKVKGLDGQEFTVEPVNGSEKFLGVIYDQGPTIRDLSSNLNNSSYVMTRLFALMSVARVVMEAGDIWLIVLAGLMLLTFKMLAPIMVILGIDRKISQRTVTAYIWGLVIITLVWPSVSYFLRSLAYLGGNMAMATGDTDQVYAWTNAAQKALRNPLAQPFYTVVIGSLMMLGGGLALWISPFLAYSFAMGRVFEGVAQQASQFAGSIVGTGIEWVSANIGAKIARQADNTQLQGSYDAEGARAKGEREAANKGIDARREQAIASLKGDQKEKLTGIYAGMKRDTALAETNRDFQQRSQQLQTDLSRGNMQAQKEREIAENENSRKQQENSLWGGAVGEWWNIGGNTVSRVGSDIGRYVEKTGELPGKVARAIPHPKAQAAGAVAEAVGGVPGLAINAGADVVGGGIQAWGAWEKYRIQRDAVNKGAEERERIINNYNDKAGQNLSTFNTEMQNNHGQFADRSISIAKDYASRSAAGVNQGTEIRIEGVNRSAGMEKEASQIRFNSQMEAAEITRNAGVNAANLRAMQHVLSQVAGKVARDIEKGIEMRF
jgi:hypothetical protein